MGQARRFVSGETPYRDGKVRQSSDATRIAEGSGGPTQETSAQALAGPRVVCSLTKQPGGGQEPSVPAAGRGDFRLPALEEEACQSWGSCASSSVTLGDALLHPERHFLTDK